jgi:hypothetical protein
MKTSRLLLFGLIVLGIGCSRHGDKKPPAKTACPMPACKVAGPALESSGIILESINAASYTYVRINTGKDTVWAAAPQFTAKIGDTVDFSRSMPMQKYQSKTLKRTFELVYFNGMIVHKGDNAGAGALCGVGGSKNNPACSMNASPMNHLGTDASTGPDTLNYSDVKKAPGGLTVAELFEQKDALAGKKVKLRGKIVKANYNIMNKTWLHFRDGSGKPGANDIAVTTSTSPQKGQIALVEGTLTKDKNIGFGYNFPLIIEDAKLEIQK